MKRKRSRSRDDSETMNRLSSARIKLPKTLAWSLKLLAMLLFAYFLYDVYVDISREYVVRRGWQYTLDEDPRSFYINIIKRVTISFVCLYLAIWGISPNNQTSTE